MTAVVGIDASRAVSDAPTGTEYYARALIDALLRLESPYRFRLYTRSNPAKNSFPQTNNYDIRSIPSPRLWTHLRLSYEMLTSPPDVLFVPSHVLPFLHPHNSLVTVHDLGYKYFPEAHPPLARAYLDLSTRWNVNVAKMVFADSNATRADILRFYGATLGKIRVVYPAFNTNVFKHVPGGEVNRVRAKYALVSPYVISVGTVQPRKNYARLVEAVASLPQDYLLVIVGKQGWGFDALLTRIQESHMATRVKMLDYVSIADLPALYAGARLAVFPSLHEGFGFPALEAQACGTPLACSNTSSLPEVAGDGAAYFDPLDVHGMGEILKRVLGNDAERSDLIERGLANVQRFSWECAAQQVLETVSEL